MLKENKKRLSDEHDGTSWFHLCFLQMTSSTKEPKLLVVAGCLRGITALMVNFTKTMEEGECSPVSA